MSDSPRRRPRFRRRRPASAAGASHGPQARIRALEKRAAEAIPCERCEKPVGFLCVCEGLQPRKAPISLLVLQHPQEPDKLLGTARLLTLQIENSKLRVGLSWPNLTKAWGDPARELDPKRWAVLYLGGTTGTPAPTANSTEARLTFVDKKGVALPEEESQEISRSLQGLIVLDGTWSQAKALWWRNAWLLKVRRCRLEGGPRSLYGELRKEPRRECLSTLESAARSLTLLGAPASLQKGLEQSFAQLLGAYREALKAAAEASKSEASAKAPLPGDAT